MRIVITSQRYVMHGEGAAVLAAHDRATALVRLGHEVHVITSVNPDEQPKSLDGVRLHYLGLDLKAHPDDFGLACRKTALSLKPDLLHVEQPGIGRFWWVGIPAKLSAAIQSPATPEQRPDLIERERLAYAEFDTVVTPGFHQAARAIKRYGLRNFPALSRPLPGRFFEDTIAPPNPHAALVVSGSGSDGELTCDTKLGEEIALRAGYFPRTMHAMSRGKRLASYDAAAVVIVPVTSARGLGVETVEAMARQRPVVAFSCTSMEAEAAGRDGLPGVRLVKSAGEMVEVLKRRAFRAAAHGEADRFHADLHVSHWLAAVEQRARSNRRIGA